MALLTIEGRYENGHIDLAETPAGVGSARVIVTFLPDCGGVAPTEAERRAAIDRLIAGMATGFNLGGEKFSREEIYDERMAELDARRERAR